MASSDSCKMGGSGDSESRRRTSNIDQQIENSKSHWSQLTEWDSDSDEDEVAEVSNMELFKALKTNLTRGYFFYTFRQGEHDDGELVDGELVVGEKFAEGAQAELYHAQIKWTHPGLDEEYLKEGFEWVLKVFKKGTLLRHLQVQWPQGLFQFHAEKLVMEMLEEPTLNMYTCAVQCGTVLEDGRFAFLMKREHEDLRILIDRCMLDSGRGCGPFPKEVAEAIMYRVAQGLDWLHKRNVVHRDLKASNVLVHTYSNGERDCYVADFECSIGVVGTGYFRAPEILQACKKNNASKRLELFTRAADVYAYGMTCYEILTGKLPFEGYPWQDYDLVLDGHRPEVPEFVDDWVHELLSWCWQYDPADRPSVEQILSLLEANSNSALIRDIAKREKSHMGVPTPATEVCSRSEERSFPEEDQTSG